jgi:hypothetical protein
VADDLIPPPSPAGRPTPGAPSPGPDTGPFASREREREREREPEPLVEDLEPPAPLTVGASRYRSRFGFIFGALLGLGVAAIALTALVVAGGSSATRSDGWSAWHPTAEDGLAAADEIALHVGRKYRLANGEQLVAVHAGPLEISELPLHVAVRTAPEGGDIELLEGDSILYTLNGLGPRGSISKGKPSPERHLLLRREALELALYTFRYVDGIDQVVTLLPPPPPEKGADAAATTDEERPTQAVFYRPGDLERQIEAPLRFTIPDKTPRPETIPAREKNLIESLTRPNLFASSFSQAQDGQAYLVLDRLAE